MDFKHCLCSPQIIILEIIFFLYKTGESMLDATTRPYITSVVCKLQVPRNHSLCRHLDSYPELENAVQNEAGTYLIIYRLLVNIPAIFLGLFCGAWSDKYGRKIPLLLPSLGSVFSALVYMLSLASEKSAIGLILFGALIQGAFGKGSVITMAVNSYVSDITDKEDRTRKLGKLLAMNFFGLFAGALLAGLFQDVANLPATFCCVVFFHAFVVFITIIALPETISLPDEKEENITVAKEGRWCVFQNIRDSIKVLTRDRPNKVRKIIVALSLISLCNQTCKVGETDITLLFVSRSPLSWPKSWYGYLLSVDYAVMGISLIAFLPILSSILKCPDGAILIAGLFCKIVRLFWAGFIQQSWMVYVSVVIGSFAGLITSSIRSIMSKSVEENELGKVFSLLASAETLSKFLGTLIFMSLYSATTNIFPGFAYIVEAVLYVFMTVIMVLIYKDIKAANIDDLLMADGNSIRYTEEDPILIEKGCKLEHVDGLEDRVPQPLPPQTP